MNYKSIASILANSLDKLPLDDTDMSTQTTTLSFDHDNVRGTGYYH